MISYRTFRNCDPPALAEIWRDRDRERGRMQPMSAALLEQYVLAKPYFDREGLILACDDHHPVGFVHSAFGPTEDESGLCYQRGVTCMLMVRHEYRRLGIGSELLRLAENYLRSRGAEVLYAGAIRPLNPFYLGLYGGSELPGVLDSDVEAQRLYQAAGYREIDRTIVFQRDLKTYRPPIDRRQLLIRRRTQVEAIHDPPTVSWWEACTMGAFDRTRFELRSRSDGRCLASATFWHMEPLSASWGVHAVGLIDLEVDAQHRREGLATFLLSECFRRLTEEGVMRVEVQTMQRNTAARALYERLGFHEVDQAAVYRK